MKMKLLSVLLLSSVALATACSDNSDKDAKTDAPASVTEQVDNAAEAIKDAATATTEAAEAAAAKVAEEAKAAAEAAAANPAARSRAARASRVALGTTSRY